MKAIIEKVARGITVTDRELADALYDICDSVHAHCNDECPVFKKNGGCVNPQRPFKENRGCDCFKSGMAMLRFLRGEGVKIGRTVSVSYIICVSAPLPDGVDLDKLSKWDLLDFANETYLDVGEITLDNPESCTVIGENDEVLAEYTYN